MSSKNIQRVVLRVLSVQKWREKTVFDGVAVFSVVFFTISSFSTSHFRRQVCNCDLDDGTQFTLYEIFAI